MSITLPLVSHPRHDELANSLGGSIKRPQVADGTVQFLASQRLPQTVQAVAVQLDTGADVSLISTKVLDGHGIVEAECQGVDIGGEAPNRLVAIELTSKSLGLESILLLAKVMRLPEPVLMLGLRDLGLYFESICVDYSREQFEITSHV